MSLCFTAATQGRRRHRGRSESWAQLRVELISAGVVRADPSATTMTPAWVLVWAVLSPATSSIVPEGDARWLSPQLIAKDPLFLGACRLLCGDGRKFCSWCTATSSPAPHSPTAGASMPATAGPHVPTESDQSAVTAAFTSSSSEPSTTPEITAATTTAPGTTAPPDVAATSESSTAPGETTAAPDTTTTTEITTTMTAFTTAPPDTTATGTTFLGPVVPAAR